MINKLLIWSDARYEKRAQNYKSASCWEHYELEHLKSEPHAFLLVGFLIKNFSDVVSKKSILSIGIDLLKDLMIVRSTHAELKVLDLDQTAVEEGNKAIKRFGFENSLTYQLDNILTYKVEKKFDCLILCQMDYIFNDKDFKKIIKKAANDEIENLIVLTPSLYEFTFHPFKMLETIHTFLYAAKTFLLKDPNSYQTYRRRRGYFTKMVSDYYRVDKYLSFKYPYGRIHLYGLKLR